MKRGPKPFLWRTVFHLLLASEGLTTRQLADAVDRTPTETASLLQAYVKRGLVRHVGRIWVLALD